MEKCLSSGSLNKHVNLTTKTQESNAETVQFSRLFLAQGNKRGQAKGLEFKDGTSLSCLEPRILLYNWLPGCWGQHLHMTNAQEANYRLGDAKRA